MPVDHLTQLLSPGPRRTEDPHTTGPATQPGELQLASIHEFLHSFLNDTTAYGGILWVYSMLAEGSEGQYRETSLGLIEACRTTHEVFATYGSVWLADNVNHGNAIEQLAGLPDYLHLYSIGSGLVSFLSDREPRKRLMIDAALRACMNSAGLGAVVDDGMPPDALSRLQHLDLPDSRLALLQRRADQAFWHDAWTACELAVGEASALAAFLDSAGKRTSLKDYAYKYDVDNIEETCMAVLYARISDLLQTDGAATLSYEGHVPLLRRALAVMESRFPNLSGRIVIGAAETAATRVVEYGPHQADLAEPDEHQTAVSSMTSEADTSGPLPVQQKDRDSDTFRRWFVSRRARAFFDGFGRSMDISAARFRQNRTRSVRELGLRAALVSARASDRTAGNQAPDE